MKYVALLCLGVLLFIGGVAMAMSPIYSQFYAMSQSTGTPQPQEVADGISSGVPWMLCGVLVSGLGGTTVLAAIVLWILSAKKVI